MAEPIADITDAYFEPRGLGRIVLVMNTLPPVPPSARFSDGLVYAPVAPIAAAAGTSGAVRRRRGGGSRSTAPSPTANAPPRGPTRTQTPQRRPDARLSVDDECRRLGTRCVFAGPRWDPFIIRFPAALETSPPASWPSRSGQDLLIA
jgi:hypothetical protein